MRSHIPLLYIASPSFSGSTLLTFLLNAHPAVATMGELKWGEINLDDYACSCGALLKTCGFWERVAGLMSQKGLPFDLKRPQTDFRCREQPLVDRVTRARVRGPLFEMTRDALVSTMPSTRQTFSTVAGVNRGLMESFLELQQATIFLDSSKDPVRLKHLLDTGDYDLYVIQLVRDGRGVMNSAIKNMKESPEQAALEWRRTHEQIDRLRNRLDAGRLLTLRYEDLCREPRQTMRRIYEWLRCDPERWVEDYRSVEHHILGNRMRLVGSSEIRLDEKWRDMLSAAQLETFERTAGELNRGFGYV